ncbi:MAG: cellulase-like family protein [Nocardioides sp.]
MTAVRGPLSITMWDFSWLERRWPGAGYEDWDLILDELVERGYEAIRIDAYPHLLSADPEKTWELLPCWSENTWGAQSIVHVQVLPNLVAFMRKARDRGLRIALSSWFREDRHDHRMRISSPAHLAKVWIDALRLLDEAELLDVVWFVDLCNEFPLPFWSSFFSGSQDAPWISRTDPSVPAYMGEAIGLVREAYPDLSYTFSFTGEVLNWQDQSLPGFDLIEPHIWMAGDDAGEYYEKVGYAFEKFSSAAYDNIVANARKVYLAEQAHFDQVLFDTIDAAAAWSTSTGLPLVTTECWAIIDYKDWPGLDWDWVLDLNARAVEQVLATERWMGVATSNFAGPQFRGVWREVGYHQALTAKIKASRVAHDLSDGAGSLWT